MGGRGTTAPALAAPFQFALPLPPLPATRPAPPTPPDPLETGYVVINRRARRGGKQYPFIERLGREWSIVIRPPGTDVAVDPQYTLDMAEPTLWWANDKGITEVYVDGLTRADFERLTGLQFDTHKGGFVLSKRVSRALREYYLHGALPSDSLAIRLMSDLSPDQKLVWDGAGVVSRRLLERMPLPPDLDEAKKAELLAERSHAQRVEFTIQNPDGQYKGHAIVSDRIQEDFILPDDCKREVRLADEKNTWLGFNFVHGHEDMRIDVQSVVNLHPFFEPGDYAGWLLDEFYLFEDMARSGKLLEAIRRIQPDTTADDLEGWVLANFAVAGGQADWSSSHTGALINQVIERVQTRDEKMRIPIPGGRLYVMTQAVAQAAGLDISVPQGQACLDSHYETVWVNDQDWLSLSGQGKHGDGIRDILGGADQDDGIWCFPFADQNEGGVEKLLLWRSPNQAGEWVVLRPSAASAALTWDTPGSGQVSYPPADSSKLPLRKDRRNTRYLGLVQPDSGGVGKGLSYEQSMQAAVERAVSNSSVLGKYCNFLMVCQAIGHNPPVLPAPLEDVIDANVKTGADLTDVSAWIDDEIRRMKRQRAAIPEAIQNRFIVRAQPDEYIPPSPTTTDHWLDTLEHTLKQHVASLETLKDELTGQAMPPAGMVEAAFENPENLTIGRKYNAHYHKALHTALDHYLAEAERQAHQVAERRSGGGKPPRKLLEQLTQQYAEAARKAAYDEAAGEAQSFLDRYLPDKHGQILAAAYVSVHIPSRKDPVAKPASEGAAWIGGPGRTRGPGHKLIETMQERGLLAKVRQTPEGLEVYDRPDPSSPAFRKLRPVVINGVWFEQHNHERLGAGQAPYTAMRDVPKPQRSQAKALVEWLAQTTYRRLNLAIRPEEGPQGPRKVAYTSDGKRFGIINPASEAQVDDAISIVYALAEDGDLEALIE